MGKFLAMIITLDELKIFSIYPSLKKDIYNKLKVII
jgi:hypothetical protein